MAYSPTMMRWAQQEPNGAQYVDGLNLYNALGNNPINRVDPTGEKHIVVVFEGLVTNDKRWAKKLGDEYVPGNDPEAEYKYYDYNKVDEAIKAVAAAASKHDPIYSQDAGSKGKLVTCFHDTVIVVGFSFGGDSAIKFANELKKKHGITVAAGLTIDPRRPPFGQFAEAPYAKPSADSWTNYWEQGDRVLRGTQVNGAQNIELKKDDFKEFLPTNPNLTLDQIYSRAHQDGYVTSHSQVVAAMKAFLQNVPVAQGHQ